MNEVTAICIAIGALFAGLAVLGWAYGDFNPQPVPIRVEEKK